MWLWSVSFCFRSSESFIYINFYISKTIWNILRRLYFCRKLVTFIISETSVLLSYSEYYAFFVFIVLSMYRSNNIDLNKLYKWQYYPCAYILRNRNLQGDSFQVTFSLTIDLIEVYFQAEVCFDKKTICRKTIINVLELLKMIFLFAAVRCYWTFIE